MTDNRSHHPSKKPDSTSPDVGETPTADEAKEIRSTPEMPLADALEQAQMENERIGGWDPQRVAQEGNTTPHATVRLAREVLSLQKTYGCLLSGPGRGDCSHFVEMPSVIQYPETIDIYGRPLGWCQVCWGSEQIRVLQENIKKITVDFNQSEKENKVYNLVFARARSKAGEMAREFADWFDTEKDKEMGK